MRRFLDQVEAASAFALPFRPLHSSCSVGTLQIDVS
jgi:hypothetical protein